MPTYDYQCDACDHTFELYQGINDAKKRYELLVIDVGGFDSVEIPRQLANRQRESSWQTSRGLRPARHPRVRLQHADPRKPPRRTSRRSMQIG